MKDKEEICFFAREKKNGIYDLYLKIWFLWIFCVQIKIGKEDCKTMKDSLGDILENWTFVNEIEGKRIKLRKDP